MSAGLAGAAALVRAQVEASLGERHDLRLPLLALCAWSGALGGLVLEGRALVGAVATVVLMAAGAAVRARAAPGRLSVLACLVLALACAATAQLQRTAVADGPVAELAAEGVAVRGELAVTADPRLRQGRFGDYVVLRGDLLALEARGRAWRTTAPVIVIADAEWAGVALGSRVEVRGPLSAADGDDLAGLLRARGEPRILTEPDAWWHGAAAVRASLRASVEHRPPDQAVLVPSLVVGDDAGLDPALQADFATTGLTHLTAVSGTNLTLIVGFLLVLARWCGVRRRGLLVVAALGIVGFILLARTEPSVVRAAAMGTAALIGLGRNGLRRGVRSLSVAVIVLVLLWPWLALTAGFALSVLATGGILLLAPDWRDALARWMPRWLAEAIAVPAAAQLACTPVVAAISGQVSLVAVVANMLVAPAVGPATVLGLAGGLVGLVAPWLAVVPGTLAAWCVGWIIAVARWGARLPAAALEWGDSATAVALLSVLCLAAVPLAPWLLRRPLRVALMAALGVLAVVVGPPGGGGWAPSGWAIVACDVGQGDGLVLAAGPGAAVVVDVGPDADAVDRCLDDLGVEQVPLLVLTHFHDDHVGGLEGLLEGRRVGEVLVSPLADPAPGAAQVRALLERHGARLTTARPGERRSAGRAALTVLAPAVDAAGAVAPGGGANDASVVAWAEVDGITALLTGDLEPPGQRSLRAVLEAAGLDRVDVLKMPHHGSRHQDLDLLLGVRPEVVLVQVGADNTHGHPADEVLTPLVAAGARVLRTDLDGAVAVTRAGAGIATARSRSGVAG